MKGKEHLQRQRALRPLQKKTQRAGAQDRTARLDAAAPLQWVAGLQRSAGNRSVQFLLNPGGPAEAPLQRQESPEEEEEQLQSKESPEIQRQDVKDEEDEEKPQSKEDPAAPRREAQNRRTQKKPEPGAGAAAPYRALEETRGQGQALPREMHDSLGQSLGYDLSPVRLHTDTKAEQLARDFGARAFTTGHDIYFGRNEYRPDTKDGMELIGHEMTHVIQQSEGLEADAGKPGDKYEQEADAVAAKLVQQGHAGPDKAEEV